MRKPEFIIIGAMKCATTTLHRQLELQRGIFMANPKETSFFSNDEVYRRGEQWYGSCFEAAAPNDLCGESSTHYTKLPTYPHTVERMSRHLEDVKLIYIMRHPLERLISQYIHEWTRREIRAPIDQAVDRRPELIAYSRYTTQLEPFLQAYGADRVLPVSFERLVTHSQQELERICRFIGYPHAPRWSTEDETTNVSTRRLRESRLRDLIVYAPGLSMVRRRLIPPAVRERVKRLWTMRRRPTLSPEQARRLRALFDTEELARLGQWLGMELTCANFKESAVNGPWLWAERSRERDVRQITGDG